MQSFHHRQDVEGLRGVLVVLVILYHAGVQYPRAAFFSVDIFLLVSGYLMAAILQRDLFGGAFSLRAFYERRARRLLPAMYLAVLLGIIAAYFIVPPADYQVMAESSLWSLALSANAYFAGHGGGYFSPNIGMQPFMHFWTLGLEFQYYLLMPIFFLLLPIIKKRYFSVVIGVLALASFLVAYFGASQGEKSVYFLLSSRVWEFLLGSLLAIYQHRILFAVAEKYRRWLADAGVLLMMLVMVLADEHTLHPGPVTLIPLVGGLLLLCFGSERSISYRLLTFRPLVLLGAISYSLYLWHQIFIALGRWYFVDGVSAVIAAALIVAAVGLSVISYRLVEVPFRNKAAVPSRPFWASTAVATLAIFFVASNVVDNQGYPERLPVAAIDEARRAASLANYSMTGDGRRCETVMADGSPCEIGDLNSPRNWAVVGDSHAGQLIAPLDKEFRGAGFSGYAITKDLCRFAVGVRLVGDRSDSCRKHNDWLMSWLGSSDIENVIIAGRGAYYYDRAPYSNGEGAVEAGRQYWFEASAGYGDGGDKGEIIASMLRPAKALLEQGKRVIFVFPIPEFAWDVPKFYLQQVLRGRSEIEISISAQLYAQRNAAMVEAFEELERYPGFMAVDPSGLFCQGQRCFAYSKSRGLLYRDDDHLNDVGASLLAAQIMGVAEDVSLSNRIVTRF